MKLYKLSNSELNIPEFLYHATYKRLLKSIRELGLGAGNRQNWSDSQTGVVYLAYDKDQAESYAETSDEVPESWLDEIIILEVSTENLDKSKFGIDRNNLDRSTIEYHGVIHSSEFRLI